MGWLKWQCVIWALGSQQAKAVFTCKSVFYFALLVFKWLLEIVPLCKCHAFCTANYFLMLGILHVCIAFFLSWKYTLTGMKFILQFWCLNVEVHKSKFSSRLLCPEQTQHIENHNEFLNLNLVNKFQGYNFLTVWDLVVLCSRAQHLSMCNWRRNPFQKDLSAYTRISINDSVHFNCGTCGLQEV